MQRKTISLVVAGSGEIRDIAISPDTTVRAVLAENGLHGYALSKGNEQSFDLNENFYNLVNDGDEVYASPEDVSVGKSTASPSGGNSFLFFRQTADIQETVSHLRYIETKKVEIIRTKRYEKALFLNKRSGLPYWMRSGWIQTKEGYKGWYRTKFGRWKGLIQRDYGDSYSFYIFDPPSELKESPHWACFSHKGNGKYHVHFQQKPDSIGDGIITIEKLITEAFTINNNRESKGGLRAWLRKLEIWC
ncbi:MAG: hypothetical protein AB1393_07685 [Candidatus Edwardsbacteria bacterium]